MPLDNRLNRAGHTAVVVLLHEPFPTRTLPAGGLPPAEGSMRMQLGGLYASPARSGSAATSPRWLEAVDPRPRCRPPGHGSSPGGGVEAGQRGGDEPRRPGRSAPSGEVDQPVSDKLQDDATLLPELVARPATAPSTGTGIPGCGRTGVSARCARSTASTSAVNPHGRTARSTIADSWCEHVLPRHLRYAHAVTIAGRPCPWAALAAAPDKRVWRVRRRRVRRAATGRSHDHRCSAHPNRCNRPPHRRSIPASRRGLRTPRDCGRTPARRGPADPLVFYVHSNVGSRMEVG